MLNFYFIRHLSDLNFKDGPNLWSKIIQFSKFGVFVGYTLIIITYSRVVAKKISWKYKKKKILKIRKKDVLTYK